MPLPPRLFPGDEELGKKDDDHKPGARTPLGISWQHRRIAYGPHKRNLKRAALGLVVLIFLYYFFKNMPTDLENPRPRLRYDQSAGSGSAARSGTTPAQGSNQKAGLEEVADISQHYFNGPIKFYQLATTLHAASRTKGSESVNQNILFAAASLKSASILLPIACEMAIRGRNHVHFALMGRDDISMDILKSVNGLSKDCKIIYHDARPDFSVHSTDYRMEVSCSAGFNHINTFVHPQATFIDASGQEELFFIRGLKDRANNLGRTIIELPENAEQTLMWTTLLDSSSLKAWNQVSIDILIHAPVSSSGSLIRLLDSLKRSDFFSSAPPRLTIELPHEIDTPTQRYLEHFRWPPYADQNSGSLLAIHHRIPQHGLTEDENCIRFLESFWPAEPSTSHVLVLSPQVELSHLFFHYLKYNMLEYKYGIITNVDENLLGISLDLPFTQINDSTTFSPPLANETVGPFLWQAPNSNAALYFGDKWVELHDFIAQSLSAQRTLITPTTLNEKLVSQTYPSWLEHILNLARVRGYYMLYPNFEGSDGLATLHTELYQSPEEYPEPEQQPSSNELTADPAHHLSLKQKEAPLVTKSLLSILPFEADLPTVPEMPLLSWDGKPVTPVEAKSSAESYRQIFRHRIGGCDTTARDKPRVALAAGDLFCLLDNRTEKDEDEAEV
ncbi:hypothetical protein D0Z07_0477 [Hyphodiscus hymeniophilus]|uniref:Glycosyltransferase 2 n=1 Tax=Hyphodiscus hymeniophilus TaxID=353542 RepID=A0A9P7B0M5_9HELO|nr:hypothetical protein D0Z07_0477 [Hyphodiscus hymeniophilus]